MTSIHRPFNSPRQLHRGKYTQWAQDARAPWKLSQEASSDPLCLGGRITTANEWLKDRFGFNIGHTHHQHYHRSCPLPALLTRWQWPRCCQTPAPTTAKSSPASPKWSAKRSAWVIEHFLPHSVPCTWTDSQSAYSCMQCFCIRSTNICRALNVASRP